MAGNFTSDHFPHSNGSLKITSTNRAVESATRKYKVLPKKKRYLLASTFVFIIAGWIIKSSSILNGNSIRLLRVMYPISILENCLFYTHCDDLRLKGREKERGLKLL